MFKQLHLVGMLVFSFNESSRGAAVALPIDPCRQPIAMPKNPYSKFEKSVRLENSNTPGIITLCPSGQPLPGQPMPGQPMPDQQNLYT